MATSKITFVTRALKSLTTTHGPTITKENDKPFIVQLPSCDGRMQMVLEFPQTYRVKNFIFKNAGTAFLSVVGGTTADFEALKVAENPPEFASKQLTTIIPETQLCSSEQFSKHLTAPALPTNPLYKVRAFPSAKFSRYVNQKVWKFLMIELRPFQDQPNHRVGLSWLEVYGEPAVEDDGSIEQSLLIGGAEKSSASATSFNMTDDWQKDADGDALMAAPRGLAAFKPTGQADRLLREELARAPPKPTQEQQARPILNRNTTFLDGLRESATAAAPSTTAASSKPLPVCSRHPTSTMIQRMDRKMDPPKQFFVCLAKDSAGKGCETKIYVD